jgi:hypothetical protein
MVRRKRSDKRSVDRGNPYEQRERWSAEYALELLDERPTDLAPGLRQAPVAWAIWGIVHGQGVPVTRRWLQTMLVHGLGYHPESITEARTVITEGRYPIEGIVSTEHSLGDPLKHRLYTFGREPYLAELGQLAVLVDQRKLWIDDLAGEAGEQFVRGAMIASGRYHEITKPDNLGKLVDSRGINKLDIAATDRLTGVRYGVSVKNTNEWLFPSASSIKNAYTMAKAHGVRPMLVVPFATATARLRCKNDDIVLIELGGLVIRAENKNGQHVALRVEMLRPLIGPVPIIKKYEQFRAPSLWHGANPFGAR